ncbi:MAG: arylsulfotransferase family protein [Solirubrobacteraceae bacterium]
MSRRSRRMRRSVLAGIILIAVLAGGALAVARKHINKEQAAYSGPSAARCVPEQLDASAVLRGTEVAVSPMPGSYDAGPETQVSFLGVPVDKLSNITVTGSETGTHAGTLESYSQGDGGSFVPESPFKSGETVTVTGEVAAGAGKKQFSFHFTVAYLDPIPVPGTSQQEAPSGSVQSFRSAPQLKPPTILLGKDEPSQVAPGDIFAAPYSGPGSTGPMILNQQGQLIWMDALPPGVKATNLQVQSYEGKEVLTWWQGQIPPQGFGLGEEIVDNTSYEEIMKIKAGNGDLADLHDFHLEPHDTAVFTVFHTIHCDLTSVGGPRDAAVTDSLYQELDLKTGLVRREWSSVDHVGLSESYSSPVKASTAWPFDFFHLNTIDPRENGTTLLSSRNTSALWIIDTKTGQILQKVGGRKSTVKQEAGAETAFQHDAMTLPNGDISIFDNGGVPWTQPESRGMVVEVDEAEKVERLVRQFPHQPAVKAGSQGDVQLQPSGGWFIGWGQAPNFSEYNANGEVIYDARMWAEVEKNETQSYRTFKFPWKATPHQPPSIAAEVKNGQVEAWASWNGATEVSGWRLLGGSSPESLEPIATTARTNFETTLKAAAKPYVAVEALNSAGEVIGNSSAIAPSG